MGASKSLAKSRSEKRIVIVGASFAGLGVAELLWDHFLVTIIDKNNYFEYVCTNPRALVKEQLIKDLTLRVDDIRAGHSNKFDFIHGKVQSVLNNNSINICNFQTKQVENIIFDYLVIATGGSY